MPKKKILLTALAITLVALGVAASAPAAGSKPTVEVIVKDVICQCGCNFPVGTCNHEVCTSRDQMKAMAEKEIAAGKDDATILQDFVLKYGVKVLATPPATGFNLTVWILPGVGAIIGLALVVGIVRRWRRPRSQPRAAPPDSIDPKLLAEIEEEMKELAGPE